MAIDLETLGFLLGYVVNSNFVICCHMLLVLRLLILMNYCGIHVFAALSLLSLYSCMTIDLPY